MTLDYRNPMHQPTQRSNGWGKAIGWALGGIVVVVLLASLAVPSLGRARETANRVKCGSCLKQIGLAALLYSNDHGGQFPPDFATMLQTQDITTEIFTCPSSDVERARGATTQRVVDSMLAGDHLSYAWTGADLTNDAPADVILAFDLERHVPKDGVTTSGINVLLADGTVQFVDEATGKAIWAQFVSGTRPIRMPTTAATSVPTSP